MNDNGLVDDRPGRDEPVLKAAVEIRIGEEPRRMMADQIVTAAPRGADARLRR
jgi:hypothetical protein